MIYVDSARSWGLRLSLTVTKSLSTNHTNESLRISISTFLTSGYTLFDTLLHKYRIERGKGHNRLNSQIQSHFYVPRTRAKTNTSQNEESEMSQISVECNRMHEKEGSVSQGSDEYRHPINYCRNHCFHNVFSSIGSYELL